MTQSVTADAEITKLAAEAREAKDNADQWDKLYKKRKDELITRLEEIGGDEVELAINASGVKVAQITRVYSQRFDQKKFHEENPEMYEQYKTPSLSVRLTV